jgi:hypothetical protein
MVRYKKTLESLERLVQGNATEPQFQRLLQGNPWLFGSEYSVLLDRRRWVRDDEQDFVLRRTIDGYLEIIEIKTPLGGTPLFVVDASRHSLHPRKELSQALGQAVRYVERVESRRLQIRADDEEDPLKVRARIIIGRDGDKGQQEALRNLNGHLHRIEIITFDQLLRIGQRIIRMFSDSPLE